MTVLLELDGVSKFYGALKAVDAVKLTVADGEALGVIGRTGSVRRLRHDEEAAARALAHGYRPLVSNTPSLREHDRFREPSGRRHLWRPYQRAGELQALQRRAENHRAPRQGQQTGA